MFIIIEDYIKENLYEYFIQIFLLSIYCLRQFSYILFVLLDYLNDIFFFIYYNEIVNNVVVHILYDMSSLYFQYG